MPRARAEILCIFASCYIVSILRSSSYAIKPSWPVCGAAWVKIVGCGGGVAEDDHVRAEVGEGDGEVGSALDELSPAPFDCRPGSCSGL
jgi:hypothetical protein